MTNREPYYVLRLTEADKGRIVAALEEHPEEADGQARADLARRIDHTAGEESILDAATAALRAWYYRRVADLAEDVLGSLVDGSETRDLGDVLHEVADSTDIVVYTLKAKAALLASDNEDAYQDRIGEAPPSPEAAAAMALEADVLERLQSMVDYGPPEGIVLPEGFDLDDSSTWRPEAEGGGA